MPNASFNDLQVDVGFKGDFRGFSEGSGGVSGGFRDAKRRPKSIFWRLFRGVFRDRDSGSIFNGFWEGPKLKNSNFP